MQETILQQLPLEVGLLSIGIGHSLFRASYRRLLRTVSIIVMPRDRVLERCMQKDCLPLFEVWGEKRTDS